MANPGLQNPKDLARAIAMADAASGGIGMASQSGSELSIRLFSASQANPHEMAWEER